MSHLGDVLEGSGVLMSAPCSSAASGSGRSARRSDASRPVADQSDSEAERSSATLLEGLSSIVPAARMGSGGGGGASGALPSMKGRRKGKAKATNEDEGALLSSSSGTSTPTLTTSAALGPDGEGAMAWESIQSDTNSNSRGAGQVAKEGTSAQWSTAPKSAEVIKVE